MALGGCLDHAVRPGQRPSDHPRGLTTQQPPLRDPGITVDDPDSNVRQIRTPSTAHPPRSESRDHRHDHQWIRAWLRVVTDRVRGLGPRAGVLGFHEPTPIELRVWVLDYIELPGARLTARSGLSYRFQAGSPDG
jgi:hypothetical protein